MENGDYLAAWTITINAPRNLSPLAQGCGSYDEYARVMARGEATADVNLIRPTQP